MKTHPSHRTAIVPALLLGLALASLSGCGLFENASPLRCVWASGADGKLVGAYLEAWAVKSGLGKLEGWDAKLQPRKARITLVAKGYNGVHDLVLGASCKTRPKVETVSERGKHVGKADLRRLAFLFPAPKKQLTLRSVRDVSKSEPAWWAITVQAWDRESWTFLLLALLLVLIAWFAQAAPAPYRRGALVLTALGVVGLVSYSVAPLFHVPFANDAPVLRAAFARESIFSDWNHSFLPYLLNRPTTWFSLQPWALRIVPFGFLLAEAALLVVVARREGGLAAGALAGVWFASEVRRRQGIVELTDWDLAGFFLLALVLWTFQRQPPAEPHDADATKRRLIWLAALMTAAFFGSFMMIVPVTALVALLWLDPAARRRFARPATVVWCVLALRASIVFLKGTAMSPIIPTFDELLRLMYLETPFSRTLWMLPPFLGALVWLAWGWRDLGRRFVAAAIVSIPLATIFAWRFSHVNQGYYICLTTPVVLFASAVAVGSGAERVQSWISGRLGGVASRAILGLGLAALTLITVSLWFLPEAKKFEPTGLRNMAAFERHIARDRLPIVTDTIHLGLYVGYERARRGVDTRGPLLPPGPKDIAARARLMDLKCRLKGGWASIGPAFYLVREAKDPHIKICKLPPRFRCKLLFKRRVWLNYYHCTRRDGK